MKRTYSTPTADKLAFCYRDQIVAASPGEDPEFGSVTNESYGSNGCKLYALEAYDYGFCDIA